MTPPESELPPKQFVGARWETEATLRRGDLVRAANAWRAYRRENGTPSPSYATLCANLDRAIDEYQEVIRAY